MKEFGENPKLSRNCISIIDKSDTSSFTSLRDRGFCESFNILSQLINRGSFNYEKSIFISCCTYFSKL